MNSTELSKAIFEQVKRNLDKSLFEDKTINLTVAGNVNNRYIFDLSITVTADSYTDDTDDENNYNVRTFSGISTSCILALADWKGNEIETEKIETILENLITKEIETN
jgi:hypothetical protein